MPRDYFSILGLAPGRYDPAEITRRFFSARERLMRQLDDLARRAETHRLLEDLHIAYAALRDPQLQAAHVAPVESTDDRIGQMRRLIAACLEDGLLRYSRRQEILTEGRRLGFSDFQTQLLIVQVQFGDGDVVAPPRGAGARRGTQDCRIAARFASAAVLALAAFLTMIVWWGR
ncbi:MAG: hypothetical protein U1D55_17600 [Phycisphaerae bacterium]